MIVEDHGAIAAVAGESDEAVAVGAKGKCGLNL
jgi:hypothetical protein